MTIYPSSRKTANGTRIQDSWPAPIRRNGSRNQSGSRSSARRETEPTTAKVELLHQAERLVSRDRNQDYGDPELTSRKLLIWLRLILGASRRGSGPGGYCSDQCSVED